MPISYFPPPAGQPHAGPASPVCPPIAFGGDADCAGLAEDWVLDICYDEKPARGVTPLRTGTAPGYRCSCGGSSSGGCGCGCGGKTGAAKSNGGRNGCGTP